MNEKKIPLHKRIKELRISKGLTQKDLAADLGLDNKMISFYENGKSIPSIDILIKIARIFNVSVDYLLFEDIPKRPFKQIDQNNSKNLNIINSIKWQIVIIIVLSISFIITGNILLYKLNKKNIQNESLIKINTIVEQININIERIKYASRIITDDQFMFKGGISLRDLNKNRASIVLDTVKTIFNASLVYFMDDNGTVIACTTFNNGETLLGQNYRFRPYFIESMNNNPYVYAALGITTHERGIYYSYPIYLAGKKKEPNGVAVIKMRVDEIDEIISQFKGIAGILSPEGIIFISNKKEWLYKSALPIDEYTLSKLRNNRQFGDEQLTKLNTLLTENEINIDMKPYSITKKDINLPGWQVFTITEEVSHFPYNYSLIITLLILLLSSILIYMIIINQKKKIIENNWSIAIKNLNESEEKYRIVFENTGTAILIFGDDKIIRMCNSKFEQLSGFSKDEIENKMKWTEFIVHDDLKRLEGYHDLRSRNKSAPSEYEFKFINKNNKTKNIYLKIGLIPGDKNINRVASLLDLTEIENRKNDKIIN